MKLGGVGRFGLGLIAGATLGVATGCASLGGWGSAPPRPPMVREGAPHPSRAMQPDEVIVPPWVRVQDCGIVAITSPSRFACPDGKVYTSFDLARARTGEYPPPQAQPPPPIVVSPLPQIEAATPPEKIILRGVHFDFNKADIRPQDAAVLDEAAETLNGHPNVSVSADGYCDAIGSVAYNQRLSEQRAEAVVTYLGSKGTAQSRLSPHGYGKTNFVASNSTEEGRAQNRRVELNTGGGRAVFLMGVPNQ
jgi:outer membrane protein OmpA-like peptidoglycan-associated protein